MQFSYLSSYILVVLYTEQSCSQVKMTPHLLTFNLEERICHLKQTLENTFGPRGTDEVYINLA